MCNSTNLGPRVVKIQVGENSSMIVDGQTFPGLLVKLVIRQLKENPSKVEAIKLVRMLRPIGLYEAKAFVDFLVFASKQQEQVIWTATPQTLEAIRGVL